MKKKFGQCEDVTRMILVTDTVSTIAFSESVVDKDSNQHSMFYRNE